MFCSLNCFSRLHLPASSGPAAQLPTVTGLLTLLLLLLLAPQAPALEVPPLKGRVNDYADMLAPATVSQLENHSS